ncbi:MAG: hypothetical protein HRF47_00135 [Chloroflexota bacterium]|jgi:hypothetical protein
MKNKPFRILSLLLMVMLLAGLFPRPAYAADVFSISPSTIINNVSNTITVSGAGFDASAVVLLDGTPLSTTVVGLDTLQALVPAGIAAGSYTITVSLTGGPANGFAVLTVLAPTPTPTTAPLPFARPQFAVYTSKLTGNIRTGGDVTLKVVMENVGKSTAYNTQATFTSSDLLATKTGGIAVVGTVDYDQEVEVSQTFYVSAQISGRSVLVVDMTLTYYDSQGTSYSDKFTLSLPVSGGTVSSGGGSAAPTATPTGVKSSQLVITGYASSVEPLQPGVQFALNMTVQNVGNANAQRITMIVGGGSSGGGSGTAVPGGVSGGGGDFSNFAPVGASNVQSLGDLKAGEKIQAVQNLVVNVSTNPGAYPLRITFSYLNDKNEVISDEQVITLLVYSLPNVNVSFYRPPDPFVVGQPGMLPIQIVNVGKRFAVLGDARVTADNGTIENGTSLVGPLDAGGFFTLDAMLMPDQPGTTTLTVTIDYVDDFNQPRTLERTIEVEVQEAFIDPSLEPSSGGDGINGGGEVIVEEETTLHKIFRFIKGLLGLDSAWPVWQAPGGGGGGIESPAQPLPAQPVPGKG